MALSNLISGSQFYHSSLPQNQVFRENVTRLADFNDQAAKKLETLPTLPTQCQMLDGNAEILNTATYAHTV